MEKIQKKITVKAADVKVNDDILTIVFNNKTYTFSLKTLSLRLANAGKPAREHFEVSPSGYGIHWPEVDEDLAVHELIQNANSHG